MATADDWSLVPGDEVLLWAPPARRRLHRTSAIVVKTLRSRVRVRAEHDGLLYDVPRAAIVGMYHPLSDQGKQDG